MTSHDRDPVREPGAIALPVTRTTVRSSKTGRWRAAVLLLVHLLIALHIAHWQTSSETLTPLEPSEAMQFTQEGIVNAGLIFFGLTILSTLIFGRWFCGWACHVVALQDATLWLLARVGLRPRPIRSPLLASVPLLVFLYMFISPLLYGQGPAESGVTVELTTSEFWRTFPTWLPALLTFLTVGVLAVYLLGAKGFCTNGCPYGAAFGLADRVAPYRIRVTDACTHCGHCTATCSSNVRVHEEVAKFGTVVDPGCMKCLDCVSVCPNDALYYGRKPATDRRPNWSWLPTFSARHALQLAFSCTLLLALLAFDRAYQATTSDIIVTLVLASVASALLWAGSTPREGRQTTLLEDAWLGLLFVIGLICLRGLFSAVALLFALGLAGVVAYLGLVGLRLWTTPAVGMHNWVLKRQGRLRPMGFVAIGVLTLTGIGLASAAQVRWSEVDELRVADQVARLHLQTQPLIAKLQQGPLAPADASVLDAALGKWIAIQPNDANPILQRSLLRARGGDVPAGRDMLREAAPRLPTEPRLWFNLALFEAETGDLAAGAAALDQALQHTPDDVPARRLRATMNMGRQEWQAAADDLRALLQQFPNDAQLKQMLAHCESQAR